MELDVEMLVDSDVELVVDGPVVAELVLTLVVD